MKRVLRAAACAVAVGFVLAAAQAHASSVTVTFGGLPNATTILNYYNGGLSGYPPAGKGPDYGLVFSYLANEQKETLASRRQSPGTGKFENNPSGASASVLYLPYSASSNSYIDDASGFTSLTFYYSLLNNALPSGTTYEVEPYSGLNALERRSARFRSRPPKRPSPACEASMSSAPGRSRPYRQAGNMRNQRCSPGQPRS